MHDNVRRVVIIKLFNALHACAHTCRMHDNVRRVISAWFNLVDADGGGSLDSTELLSALKVGTWVGGTPACDQE